MEPAHARLAWLARHRTDDDARFRERLRTDHPDWHREVVERGAPLPADPVAELVLALGDRSPGARASAIEALRSIGPACVRRIGDLLVAPVETWTSPASAQPGHFAPEALGALGPEALEARPRIVEALDTEGCEDGAREVIELLGAVAAPLVPDLLARVLRTDPGETWRPPAKDSAWTQTLVAIGTAALPEVRNALTESALRPAALWALTHLGPAVYPIIEAEMAGGSVAEAVYLAAQFPSWPESLDVLVREYAICFRHPDPGVRWSAAAAFHAGNSKGPAPVAALQSLLADPQARVRREAARTLRSHAAVLPAARALFAALGNPDPRVRQEAVLGVAASTLPEAERVNALVAAVADPDAHVRHAAVERLAALRAKARQALPAIRATLDEADWIAPAHAVAALAAIAAPDDAIGMLATAVLHADWRVQLEAAVQLPALARHASRAGQDQAVRALVVAGLMPRQGVRKSAAEGLAALAETLPSAATALELACRDGNAEACEVLRRRAPREASEPPPGAGA